MTDRGTSLIHLITLFKNDDIKPISGTMPLSLLRDVSAQLWVGAKPLDLNSYLGHSIKVFGVAFTVVADGDCTVTGADGTVRALKEVA